MIGTFVVNELSQSAYIRVAPFMWTSWPLDWKKRGYGQINNGSDQQLSVQWSGKDPSKIDKDYRHLSFDELNEINIRRLNELKRMVVQPRPRKCQPSVLQRIRFWIDGFEDRIIDRVADILAERGQR